jgi:aromatic ring hydroxylase
MLISGKEKLERMRDGRAIYIGAERVDDVTRHPAFRNAKLYKLVWDLIGSEFAGRHMLYERFYAGNSIIVRNQSDREAPWDAFHATVDGLLERVQAPDLPA